VLEDLTAAGRRPHPVAVESPDHREAQIREFLVDHMPIEHAPAHLRLAFHDAGTYDLATATGGPHGTIRLPEELHRAGNTGWAHACLELLAEAQAEFPWASWADLIAVGGAAAIQKCGGPIIEVGLGRSDSAEVAPPHRLPGGYEGAAMLKRMFARMGLSVQDLAALSGAHTLGHSQRQSFTQDPYAFSNSYYAELLSTPERSNLPTDTSMLDDPELRPYVELYAADQARFLSDFADAFRRLTWLGYQAQGSAAVTRG
jgi:L-ascorbate peroxidase